MDLDLRNTPCPINFVRTKLALEKLELHAQLSVMLDDGEAIESVSTSIVEEGHKIALRSQEADSSWLLVIEKMTI